MKGELVGKHRHLLTILEAVTHPGHDPVIGSESGENLDAMPIVHSRGDGHMGNRVVTHNVGDLFIAGQVVADRSGRNHEGCLLLHCDHHRAVHAGQNLSVLVGQINLHRQCACFGIEASGSAGHNSREHLAGK